MEIIDAAGRTIKALRQQIEVMARKIEEQAAEIERLKGHEPNDQNGE